MLTSFSAHHEVYSYDDHDGDTALTNFTIDAAPSYLFSVIKDIMYAKRNLFYVHPTNNITQTGQWIVFLKFTFYLGPQCVSTLSACLFNWLLIVWSRVGWRAAEQWMVVTWQRASWIPVSNWPHHILNCLNGSIPRCQLSFEKSARFSEQRHPCLCNLYSGLFIRSRNNRQ